MNGISRQLEQAVEDALEGELQEAQNMAYHNSNSACTPVPPAPAAQQQRHRTAAQNAVVCCIRVLLTQTAPTHTAGKNLKIL